MTYAFPISVITTYYKLLSIETPKTANSIYSLKINQKNE